MTLEIASLLVFVGGVSVFLVSGNPDVTRVAKVLAAIAGILYVVIVLLRVL